MFYHVPISVSMRHVGEICPTFCVICTLIASPAIIEQELTTAMLMRSVAVALKLVCGVASMGE